MLMVEEEMKEMDKSKSDVLEWTSKVMKVFSCKSVTSSKSAATSIDIQPALTVVSSACSANSFVAQESQGHPVTASGISADSPKHEKTEDESIIKSIVPADDEDLQSQRLALVQRKVERSLLFLKESKHDHQSSNAKKICENKDAVKSLSSYSADSPEILDYFNKSARTCERTCEVSSLKVCSKDSALGHNINIERLDEPDSGTASCEAIVITDSNLRYEKPLSSFNSNRQLIKPCHGGDGQSVKTVIGQNVHIKQEEIVEDMKVSEPQKEKNMPLKFDLTKTSNITCESSDKGKPLQGNKASQKHEDGIEKRNLLKQEDVLTSDTNKTDAVSGNAAECRPKSRGRPRKLKKAIKCEYCERTFSHLSLYIIHRRIHTGEKPFNCQECGKAFAQLSNLRSHSKTHEGPKKRRIKQPSLRFSMPKVNSSQNRLHDIEHHSHRKQIPVGNFQKDHCTRFDNPMSRKGKHLCSFCGKGFRFRSVLNIHLRVHSGEKPFSCKVCGKAFTQACTLRIHERIHWSIKPFLCSLCGKGFSQIGTLKGHTCKGSRQIHATLKDLEVSGAVTFRCHLCRKCFDHRREYVCHLETHTDTPRYSCDACGQKYSLLSELNAHRSFCSAMRAKHNKPHHSRASVNRPLRRPQRSQYTTCLTTPIKTEVTQPVQQRKQTNTILQKRKQRKYASLLTSPRQTISTYIYDPHNDLKHNCSIEISSCISEFNHLKKKSDPRKYVCPQCGRLFRHVGRLRAHMLTHPWGQRYTCGHCGKTLENWRKFWHHQRIHRQKRGRFFCPKCGQGFRFVGMYNKHVQDHPELNAHFCALCPQTFFSSETLRDHIFEWHNLSMSHICDTCGKGFESQTVLERHNVAHSRFHSQIRKLYKFDVQPPILPYLCAQCDSSFKTLDQLFHHQLCHITAMDKQVSKSIQSNEQQNDERLKDENLRQVPVGSVLNPTDKNSSATPIVKDCPSVLYSGHAQDKPLQSCTQSSHTPVPVHPGQQKASTSVHQCPSSLMPQCSDSQANPFSTEQNHPRGSEDETSPKRPHALKPSLECSVCGSLFTAIPTLFSHYLQHARGEV